MEEKIREQGIEKESGIKQSKKLMEWIKENMGFWEAICGKGEEKGVETLQMAISKLAEEGLYEIILTALYIYRENRSVNMCMRLLFLNLLSKEWEERHEEIIEEILYYLE